MPESQWLETPPCPVCGAAEHEPCDFGPDGPPLVTNPDGTTRRAVHAARYALWLPEEDRAGFWQRALEDYFHERLAEPEGVEHG